MHCFEEELHKLIEERAYEISRHRNGSGNATGDWVQAEQEILRELHLRNNSFFDSASETEHR